ncbi:hypothetical protein LLH00_14480 [bacterium]|nr:hypothetical protein [bacterium]
MNRPVTLSITVLCWIVLGLSGCEQRGASPFFLGGSQEDNPERPVAPLSILAGGEKSEADSCRIETSRKDSLIFLEAVVSPLIPDRIGDRYVKITLDVSVGLHTSGAIISDTLAVELDGPGSYPLMLKVENASLLAVGGNDVAVTALTRYLDGTGGLVAPLGRELRYCNLVW